MEKTITEVTNRGIRITCTLAAPVATVGEVWTNPEQIATCWGPSGFTSTIHTMDLVEGGEWRLSMFSPDGKNCPNKSIFKEIVPHTKIVFQHFNPNYMATILFEPGDRKPLWIGRCYLKQLNCLIQLSKFLKPMKG